MANPLDAFRDGALAGHVALITGGGTGICRGIAAAYARFGAEVCIVSRKQDVLDATAAAIGRTPLAVAADVRDPASIAAAAVYLRSAAGAYVTGHTLVVDGGHCIASPQLGMMS